MTLDKIFKILLWVFLIDFLISFIVISNTPELPESNITIFDFLVILFAVIQIISVFMLFKFSSKGRFLFVTSTFLAIFFSFFLSQFTIPDAKYYDISRYTGGFIDGAIVIMMYLTSLDKRFAKY